MNIQMKKSLVVAAVALALTGIQAEAAKSNQDKYKDVIIYGNTSLAEDSMNDWGPWKQFILPAAGGSPVPQQAAFSAVDPVPDVRQPQVPVKQPKVLVAQLQVPAATPLQAPVEEPQVPVEEEDPHVPVDYPQTPIEEPQVPVEEPQVPEDDDPHVPVDDPQVPVDYPQTPIDEPQVPVDEPQVPVDDDPQVPVEDPIVEGPCAAGAGCGFATYQYDHYEYSDGYYDGGEGSDGAEGGGVGGPVPASIALNLNITPSNDGGEGEGGSVNASYIITPKQPHSNYPQVDSLAMSDDHIDDYDDVTYYSTYGEESTTGADAEYGEHYSEIEGAVAPETTGDFTTGWWEDGAYSESDNDNRYWSYNDQERNGSFVYGTTSTMEEMEALNVGNVIATYVGYTMDYGTDMVIEVDFGSATFNASVNEGSDGSTWVMTDENGVTYVMGEVGYNASGTISGANITANNISANDGTVSGTMEGAFFGANASILAGQHDIVKTVDGAGGYTHARHVDNFVTEDISKTGGILENVID